MIIIAFEGIDGSGKSTQAAMLSKTMAGRGYNTLLVSFPRRHQSIGHLINRWLQGSAEFGLETLHLLFELDKIDFFEQTPLDFVDVLILDRYTLSNIAYANAKGIDTSLILTLQRRLPRADYTILLDIDPDVAVSRLDSQDRHENIEFLNRVRKEYISLAREESAIVIPADGSVFDVHDSVLSSLDIVMQHV